MKLTKPTVVTGRWSEQKKCSKWRREGKCKENEVLLSGTRLYRKKLSSKDDQDSMQPDLTHVTLVGDY